MSQTANRRGPGQNQLAVVLWHKNARIILSIRLLHPVLVLLLVLCLIGACIL